ncbi:MAG: hypothetical protein AABX38_00420 [Candidatus Micrarchaeota archaeon]
MKYKLKQSAFIQIFLTYLLLIIGCSLFLFFGFLGLTKGFVNPFSIFFSIIGICGALLTLLMFYLEIFSIEMTNKELILNYSFRSVKITKFDKIDYKTIVGRIERLSEPVKTKSIWIKSDRKRFMIKIDNFENSEQLIKDLETLNKKKIENKGEMEEF